MQRINDLNLTKQLVRQCVVKQTSVGSSPEQSGELRPAQSTSFLQNWQILLTHNEDSKVRRWGAKRLRESWLGRSWCQSWWQRGQEIGNNGKLGWPKVAGQWWFFIWLWFIVGNSWMNIGQICHWWFYENHFLRDLCWMNPTQGCLGWSTASDFFTWWLFLP